MSWPDTAPWRRGPCLSSSKVLGGGIAEVRQRSATLLGLIGKEARPAAEKLVKLQRDDPDPMVRWMATDALARISAALDDAP